jgi:hypothetical protein
VSRGKPLLQALTRLFPSQEAHDFALNLQADIYFYLREHGPADDETVARALESLKSSFSRILLPEAAPSGLARFLIERLGDGRRYPVGPKFTPEERLRAVGTLVAFVLSLRPGSLPADGSRRYNELISSFFDALDFEADLDYSPYDTTESPPPERRTESGLILPP